MDKAEKGKEQSEQTRQAVRMYEDGVPVEEIRSALRIGYKKLSDLLYDSGVTMRGGGPYQETDPEKLRQAVEMYVAGEYIKTIKRNLHIAERTLYKALRDAGVPVRFPRGTKKETPRYENKRLKRARRERQTTTNIVMLQHSFGADFVGLANKVLAGELAFRL